jgi:hypothetical protein
MIAAIAQGAECGHGRALSDCSSCLAGALIERIESGVFLVGTRSYQLALDLYIQTFVEMRTAALEWLAEHPLTDLKLRLPREGTYAGGRLDPSLLAGDSRTDRFLRFLDERTGRCATIEQVRLLWNVLPAGRVSRVDFK